MLSFFFDGVPEINVNIQKADTVVNTTDSNALSLLKPPDIQAEIFVHPPYADRECKICHREGGEFSEPQPQLCYQCHEDFTSKYLYIHGPVAGGYCTECHHPHSGKKKLLIRQGQDLCLYCHEKEFIFKNENHSEIGETDCTECHNPHGGQDKTLFN